jgi:putative endonuclease
MPSKRKKPSRLVKKSRVFQRRGAFHVYMLECKDGSYYTGYTNDLERRIALHNKGGGSKYVKTRLPAKLVFCKPYKYFKLAILEERRMKKLSRDQKELIVKGYRPAVKAVKPRARKRSAKKKAAGF